MMSASVLKRKDVAKNFSFTGIDIKILKEEIMQGSKCCTYILLIQELHVFGDEYFLVKEKTRQICNNDDDKQP